MEPRENLGKQYFVLLDKSRWIDVMFLLRSLETVQEGYNKTVCKEIIEKLENLEDAPER